MNRFTTSLSFRSRIAIVATCALLAPWSTSAFAGPITSGQLVNIRVGDGTTTPSGTALPVTLDVYNVTYTAGVPTGVSLGQSIPLPTATTGTAPTSGNRYLTQGGTAGGEGGLTLSTDGRYMALGGYNTIVGGSTNASGSSTDRVVGLLDLSAGTVDTMTDYTNTGATNAIRNAFTTNGTDIWTANSSNGVRYVAYGSSTSTALTSTGNERRVMVVNNQLYTSRMSGTIDGVATVGSPPPPTSGTATVTLLPGMPTATNSIYDYFFADASTLYVSDDRNSGTGGLEKWTFSGTTWTMAYSKLAAGTTGLKSLTGMVDASGNVVLFGASTGNGNKLYGYTDTLANTNVANVTENQLVNATTDFTGSLWGLRGVSLVPGAAVPEPATLSLLALSCVAFISRRSRSVR
ncbi:MAG TPA: PEP-CTERM sorting domain-containing protein [Lacipirellulaceae bacterium]|jgi:hypothetical protein|nr:PEP-CTERM sorting domain-containing protein [Lacipirellulaceae bacterium]